MDISSFRNNFSLVQQVMDTIRLSGTISSYAIEADRIRFTSPVSWPILMRRAKHQMLSRLYQTCLTPQWSGQPNQTFAMKARLLLWVTDRSESNSSDRSSWFFFLDDSSLPSRLLDWRFKTEVYHHQYFSCSWTTVRIPRFHCFLVSPGSPAVSAIVLQQRS